MKRNRAPERKPGPGGKPVAGYPDGRLFRRDCKRRPQLQSAAATSLSKRYGRIQPYYNRNKADMKGFPAPEKNFLVWASYRASQRTRSTDRRRQGKPPAGAAKSRKDRYAPAPRQVAALPAPVCMAVTVTPPHRDCQLLRGHCALPARLASTDGLHASQTRCSRLACATAALWPHTGARAVCGIRRLLVRAKASARDTFSFFQFLGLTSF